MISVELKFYFTKISNFVLFWRQNNDRPGGGGEEVLIRKYERLIKWNTKTNKFYYYKRKKTLKMCDFYPRDREAENWKVGRFWQIFKKAEDSLPLSLNRKWRCFNAKYIEQGSKERFRLYAIGKQRIFIIVSHYKSW